MEDQIRKTKLRIPLFWKFATGLFIVVGLFGSINILLIHRIIYSSLEGELEQRGLYISRTISERATDQLLFDDIAGLHRLVNEMKSIDPSVEYVFILNRNREVAAHTFEDYFPAELINVQEMPYGSQVGTVHVLPGGSGKLIRDIAVPLLDGRAGYARVGLSEDHIDKSINRAVSILIGMVGIFLIAGIGGTMAFAYMVTMPVKIISGIAENTDLDAIQNKKVKFVSRYPGALNRLADWLPDDEMDTLISKFNEMISRLQHAYDELELAQRKLLQSEKLASIGSLAAGVAHEVNNPLAGMMHCIERISRKPGNQEATIKYIALMQEAAVKIEKVTKGLLGFARQPEQTFTINNLKLMIDNALMLASHKLNKHDIEISQDHIEPLPEILVNKNRFEQVLLNLFLNSIDAISEKQANNGKFTGSIRIGSVIAGNHLEVLIRDNGTGINAEEIRKVMDPFYSTKAMGEGTGLGLPVSIGIMKEHGGDLEITSEWNVGTSVRLTIPLHHT